MGVKTTVVFVLGFLVGQGTAPDGPSPAVVSAVGHAAAALRD